MAIDFNGFDYRMLIGVAAALVLLFNLVAVLTALRRARSTANASAALVAELAVYKDAAFSLGEHLVRRGSTLPSEVGQSGSMTAATHSAASSFNDRSRETRQASLRSADAVAIRQSADARETHPVSSGNASNQLLDTERAVELARRGASVDDLVAACDLSRTEAGLILAMTRRGRTLVGRPQFGGA